MPAIHSKCAHSLVPSAHMGVQTTGNDPLQSALSEQVSCAHELVRKWIVESDTERFGKKKPGEPKIKPNSAAAREAKAKRAKK